jgi:uncharacterized membrane protein YccC
VPLHRLKDPVLWADVAQIAKTALAAVIAWMLATHALHIEQAFLAPWAALLTVNATVYGTVRRGVQQVATTVAGVLIAFAAASLLGVGPVAVGGVVLAGLIVGQARGLHDQATTAAATALVVLTAGYADDGGMLASRLLDTGIGIGVGLVVNLLVWPPLRDRAAAHRIDVIDDRIGELLREIAGGSLGADDWIERANELDGEIDEAWNVLGQARESGRLNPRPAVRERMHAAERFAAVLTRLEQAVAELRSMAFTVDRAPAEFRAAWLELLDRAGSAIGDADAAGIANVRSELEELDAPSPVAGALLVNLRNILEALGAVADVQPVRVPG